MLWYFFEETLGLTFSKKANLKFICVKLSGVFENPSDPIVGPMIKPAEPIELKRPIARARFTWGVLLIRARRESS